MATQAKSKSTVAPAPPTQTIQITPSPDAQRAVDLASTATTLLVVDQASHTQALEYIKTAKVFIRAITAHYKAITDIFEQGKRSVWTLRDQHLAAAQKVIDTLEPRAMTYLEAEERRARAEQERIDREAQEAARVRRAKELADQQAEAERLEALSDDLSARQQTFVDELIRAEDAGHASPSEYAAGTAGFSDPVKAAARLLGMPKMQQAIMARRQAIALRAKQEATAAAPLDVEPTRKVETQVGKVAGMWNTTTYRCEIVNLNLLRKAYRAEEVPAETFAPDQSLLNKQATNLKDHFEAAYPGCKLIVDRGLAG